MNMKLVKCLRSLHFPSQICFLKKRFPIMKKHQKEEEEEVKKNLLEKWNSNLN